MTTGGSDDFPVDDAELLRRMRGSGPRRLFAASGDEFDRVAGWAARQPPPDLSAVAGFVIFVGYPRSGHSLVGALLDAHPEIAIAHELDVLQLHAAGLDRNQILTLLLENSRRLGRLGRRWGEYDYHVPGGAQGRWTRLRLVGDKRGGETSRRLAGDPEAIDRFGRMIGMPLRFLHVVRDPADTAATMVRRARARPGSADEPEARLLGRSLTHYAHLARANARFLARTDPAHVRTLWHEDFVADPRAGLAGLCRFLGVGTDAAYIEACASVVAPSPRRTRDTVTWADAHRATFDRIVRLAPFLARYAGSLP
ncbi:sulfotransferase [Stella sp.]|uniref:sulfotransferase family protein n=1 Tax=Stella sp. TaxID=2912054 RepID=UPI0035B0EF03